jgi:hypothetical protein
LLWSGGVLTEVCTLGGEICIPMMRLSPERILQTRVSACVRLSKKLQEAGS